MTPVPRQLLAAPPHFVGRDAELARLTEHRDGTVLISAISGAGGIGKTALALRWAHDNLPHFPDGQLFVDLQGFSPTGSPTDPATAIRGFLTALGVEPGSVPPDLQAQAALYRSLTAGKRMLIVLDNAADATQVTPLLPGTPTCTVLVTSRRRLTSLITRHGAHHLQIDVLTEPEARQLLTTRLGRRATANPAALNELLTYCGGYALALGIVAGRATMNPLTPLARLAEELNTLSALDDDEPTVSLPAVLSWSVQALPKEQATAFGLLGIAPGADIALPAATSLLGLPLARTQRVLSALVDASLLNADANGRHTMHDLVRDHATTVAEALPRTNQEAALHRVIDFYLHTAHAADRLFYPHRQPITLEPPTPGAHHHPLQDSTAALAWFNAEHANLLAAQQAAVRHGLHQSVWQLAWTLNLYHAHQGHNRQRLAVWRLALAAAEHVSDSEAHHLIHLLLGRAYANAGQHDEAVEHLHRALTLAEQRGNLEEQAGVHANLAWAWIHHGDHQTALSHGQQSLRIRRAIGNQLGEADSLNTVGWCAALLGDYTLARESGENALALQRHHGHEHGEGSALLILGYVDHHTGLHLQAVDHFEQARVLFRRIGNYHDAAEAADRLGSSYAALGKDDDARDAWQEALGLYRRQGRDKLAAEVQRQLSAREP
jgi:tetratricopeptide (TPR) repeat protein